MTTSEGPDDQAADPYEICRIRSYGSIARFAGPVHDARGTIGTAVWPAG